MDDTYDKGSQERKSRAQNWKSWVGCLTLDLSLGVFWRFIGGSGPPPGFTALDAVSDAVSGVVKIAGLVPGNVKGVII